jgi:large subunit ribosomal protein L10
LALNKEQKEKIIAAYIEKFSKSQAMIMASYTGMTVAQLTALRGQLRESGNGFVVIKNSLARIALERMGRKLPQRALAGTLALGLCYKDIAAVAKTFNSVALETKIFPLMGAILGNQVVDAERAKALVNMPTRDVLIGQVVGSIQAPLSGLVGVLNGPLQGFINVLQARADQLKSAEQSA